MHIVAHLHYPLKTAMTHLKCIYTVMVQAFFLIIITMIFDKYVIANEIKPSISIVTLTLSDISAPEATRKLQLAINNSSTQNNKLIINNKDCIIYISSTIFIPSNSNIDFNNCTIRRDTKYGIFDMILNNDKIHGNSNIMLQNLRIDGNKDADYRKAEAKSDRFIGLGLFKCNNIKLINIDVHDTVNAEIQREGARAGIYFENCLDVMGKNINGHDNDRTAILIKDSTITIDGSVTYNNYGSGISSNNADRSQYYNIVTHDNGYSQLSVNGNGSKVAHVVAYNGAKGFSNLNIGHNTEAGDSSNTIVNDVKINGGNGWGITVAGSNNVTITDASVVGNNYYNVYAMDNVDNLTLNNIVVSNSKSTGIYYKSGTGHVLNNANIFNNNSYGIEVDKQASVMIGPNVSIYNNGKHSNSTSYDLVVIGSAYLGFAAKFGSSDIPKIASIWLAGGKVHIDPDSINSFMSTTNIRKTSGGEITTNSEGQ